jgi:hypothetical protein
MNRRISHGVHLSIRGISTYVVPPTEQEEYGRIQRKYQEIAGMTGQNLWTARGDGQMEIRFIVDKIKASVDEAKALADLPTASAQKKSEITLRAKEAVGSIPGFVDAIKKLNSEIDNTRSALTRAVFSLLYVYPYNSVTRVPMDRSRAEELVRACHLARTAMMQSYERLLEAYIYTSPPSGKLAPSSISPSGAGIVGAWTIISLGKREFSSLLPFRRIRAGNAASSTGIYRRGSEECRSFLVP